MTLRSMVIVADDAGLHADTDAAILDCVRAGSVTAVSVAVTGPTWRHMVDQLASLDVDVGLHLNLTEGHALGTRYDTLTDADNVFRGPKQHFHELVSKQEIDVDEIEAEIRAQWAALSAAATPRFINGHNHVHLSPDVCNALCVSLPDPAPWIRVPVGCKKTPQMFTPLCTQSNLDCLRALGPSCEHFVGWAFIQDPSMDTIRQELAEVTADTCEWMTHPGARAGNEFTSSAMRTVERDVLCAPSFRDDLAALGFAAVRYRDLT